MALQDLLESNPVNVIPYGSFDFIRCKEGLSQAITPLLPLPRPQINLTIKDRLILNEAAYLIHYSKRAIFFR